MSQSVLRWCALVIIFALFLGGAVAVPGAGAVTMAGDPAAVVPPGSQRIDLVGRGADDHLWHRWYNNYTWNSWEDLGAPPGGMQGKPSAVSWGDGHLDVFVRSNSDQLWHRYYYGGWSNWIRIGTGTISASPRAVSWGWGRIDVFSRGDANQMIHAWADTSVGGTWSDFENLGGLLTSGVSVVTWEPGHLDAFSRGSDGRIYHRYFYQSSWHAWEVISGNSVAADTGMPQAVSWGKGHVDVYVRGTGNNLWHVPYVDTMGGWGNVEDLGGQIAGNPAPVTWGYGHMDVYARGNGDPTPVYHRYLDFSANVYTMVPWELTTPQVLSGDPTAVTWGSGHIDVYARTADGQYMHDAFVAAMGGWTGWQSLGNPDTTPPNVSLSGPAVDMEGVLFGARYNLHVDASDASGVASVRATLDGSSTPFAQLGGSGDITVDALSMPPGEHVVSVVATDARGNVSAAQTLAFDREIAEQDDDLEPDEAVPAGGLGTDDDATPVDSDLRAEFDEPGIDSAPTMTLTSPDGTTARVAGHSKEDYWLGLSDETASTFANSTFQDLKVKHLRLIIPYNLIEVLDGCPTSSADWICQRAQGFASWLAAQRDANDPTRMRLIKNADGERVDVLVSFERRIDYLQAVDNNVVVTKDPWRPDDGKYQTAIENFMNRYPWVHYYTAWNEPNLKNQPYHYNPHSTYGAYLAGRLYGVLNKLCRAHHCVALAGDFSDSKYQNFKKYLSAYKTGMYTLIGKNRVGAWAIHLHRTAQAVVGKPGGDSSFLSAFLTATRNSSEKNGGPPVWITEVGPITRKGIKCDKGFSPPDPVHCPVYSFDHSDSPDLRYKSLKNILAFSRSDSRIKRTYIYQWRGDLNWDSGLASRVDEPFAPRKALMDLYEKTTNQAAYRPKITAAPRSHTTDDTASVSFSSEEAPSSYECRLDDGGWSDCTSPKTYSGLPPGSHEVDVRSVLELEDGSTGTVSRGYTNPTLAAPAGTSTDVGTAEGDAVAWTIDVDPPQTFVSTAPTDPTGSTSASVAFGGTDNVAVEGYECRLDGSAWEACTSPKDYSGLENGTHTFDVRAHDAAGNIDDTPDSVQWRVDTDIPDNVTAPTVSGTPQVGQTLTGVDGSWTGAAPTFARAWQRCDSAGANCQDIAGATSSTYVLTAADGAKRVRLVVKATSYAGSASASATPTAAVKDYAAVVAADHPYVGWRLGEASTATTAVGFGTYASPATQFGSTVGALTFGVPGAVVGNTAILSAGTGRGLVSSYAPSLPYTFTVEAWVRTDPGWKPATGKVGAIVARYQGWSVAVLANGHAGVKSYYGAAPVDSGLTVDDGAWHHVVVALTGSSSATVSTYVDGVAGGTGTTMILPYSTKISIGGGSDDSGATTMLDSLAGSVDEVAIYPAVLTVGQVSAHYAAGTTGRPVLTSAPAVVGTPDFGATLSASNGTWNGAGVTVTRQWERCSVAGDACTPIAGATGSTYKITHDDGGKRLGVLVRASSPSGDQYAMSALTATLKSYDQVILADAPESYWRLSEAAGATSAANAGSSGVAATFPAGTYPSTMQFGVPGMLAGDTAVQAMGFLSELVGGTGPAMDGTFSAEAWVKTAAGWKPPTGSAGGIVSKYRAWGLYVLDNGHAGAALPSTSTRLDSGVTVDDGAWHHLVVTVNGTALTLYVDGVSRATSTWAAAATTSRISIGAGTETSYSSNLEMLAGTMDEVAAYNTTLTAAQVAAHYVAGRG